VSLTASDIVVVNDVSKSDVWRADRMVVWRWQLGKQLGAIKN